ncbi:MAG: Gfo/Idh/MocA family oxidoreductase [Oceanibaculum nanhaiense]|uniref:Gfo/Idh/MocA family protein n=1 Tax=Oceanibaculum nanhaiense TaxID=1909734 RepID=UPI0025A49F4E|nr:Gfo/Idh/MocA family oxidoreductase [Oceanibaculum nanhaiense]MDM7947741.1 Gfo/Idh/MocA family oxidoreductase [Oceanibaculum nanhaiense]
MASDAKPPILVCGGGSIGRRHIGNLLQLGAPVIGWRARAEKTEEIAREFGIPTLLDLDEAIEAASAVVVATATDRHMEPALKALRAGKPLFLEKPVSHSRKGIADLAALAEGKVVEVGCQLRAHPSLTALHDRLTASTKTAGYRLVMGQRLDEWRPDSDYRQGYSADAARGGGALFDLVHQIDLALWLFGPVRQVAAMLDRRGGLAIAGDDFSSLMLRHADGTVGQIQLDMISPAYRGAAEVVTLEDVFDWSLATGTLTRRRGEQTETLARVPDGFQRNDLFLAHMRHFLARLDDPSLPTLCPLTDGIAALDILLAARKSHEESRFVTLESKE